MTFTLTDNLINNIICAMENQEEVFALDASSGELVYIADKKNYKDNNMTWSVKVDNDRYYELPEWKPSDGFSVREEFVYNLHSPLVKDELQMVLHSGRGVFKNFRIVLKDYPEIDKRWHIYKNKVMANKVNEWYNSLREIWGLEKLDQFPEIDESLVYDDFSFYEYISDTHKKIILSNILAVKDYDSDEETLPSELNNIMYELWLEYFEKSEERGQVGYVCYSLAEDFAGCITASSVMKNQKEIFVITSLFVSEQFRGLGICTQLVSKCISQLKKSGIKFIIMPDYIVSKLLEPLLIRTGFKSFKSGYYLAF